MRNLLASTLLLLLCPWAPADEPRRDVRAAVIKALPLIQQGAAGHRVQRTCFACHHQGVPILALTVARSRGLAVDEDELRKHDEFIVKFLDKNRANYLQGKGQGGQVDTAGYALWALALNGHKPDAATAAVAEYLLLARKEADHWTATSNRPPSEASPFTTSYVALRGLQTYGTQEQKERIAKREESVRGWLARTPAKDTEDRVFRLWALQRAGADTEAIKAAAQELRKTQRADGGWAQLETLEADAYATGSALVALHEAAGLPTTDAAYARGLAFLLATQQDDGSWHVKSRSKPFQTYFESGFPHGKDQFISLAASSWAAAALILSLPPEQPAPKLRK